MEIIAAAFAVGLLINWLEKRAAFPDQPCAHCDMWVSWKKNRWIHEDGEQYGKWPQIDYDYFPNSPLHPASPSNLW